MSSYYVWHVRSIFANYANLKQLFLPRKSALIKIGGISWHCRDNNRFAQNLQKLKIQSLWKRWDSLIPVTYYLIPVIYSLIPVTDYVISVTFSHPSDCHPFHILSSLSQILSFLSHFLIPVTYSHPFHILSSLSQILSFLSHSHIPVIDSVIPFTDFLIPDRFFYPGDKWRFPPTVWRKHLLSFPDFIPDLASNLSDHFRHSMQSFRWSMTW